MTRTPEEVRQQYDGLHQELFANLREALKSQGRVVSSLIRAVIVLLLVNGAWIWLICDTISLLQKQNEVLKKQDGLIAKQESYIKDLEEFNKTLKERK